MFQRIICLIIGVLMGVAICGTIAAICLAVRTFSPYTLRSLELQPAPDSAETYFATVQVNLPEGVRTFVGPLWMESHE